MTLPSHIASTVFVDGELTTEVKWYTRIFTVINDLIDYVATLGAPTAGLIEPQTNIADTTTSGGAETLSATTIPLSGLTIGANYAVNVGGNVQTASTSIDGVLRVRVDTTTVTTSSPEVGSIRAHLSSAETNLPVSSRMFFGATATSMVLGFSIQSTSGSVEASFTELAASVEAV